MEKILEAPTLMKLPKGLRVALVHDWLTGYRGGEKVLEGICQIFPDAPLFTLIHIPGSVPQTIENREIVTSFLQHLPLATTRYRHYLPLFPLASETLLGTRKFDLIISTSHAVAKSVRSESNALHWCYIHSPMRYVWDRFDDYFGPSRVGQIPSEFFFRPIAAALRWYDFNTRDRVGCYVANSSFVAKRVADFYGKNAQVIAPPVDVERFSKIERHPEDFYLFFSALVPYKKADHAILACQKLGRQLVLVGGGPEMSRLRSLADPKWIRFEGGLSASELDSLFSRAKALLFPAIEDFGIVPVEATAAGLPVIGIHDGGLLDSQTEKTCQFYSEQTVQGLMTAILEFEKAPQRFVRDDMRNQAQKFSKVRFLEAIQNSIENFVLDQLP